MDDNPWKILTDHLIDPVRGRIFFELMMNDNQTIDIATITKLTKRARNTINHHIDRLLDDEVIIEVDSKQHGRGRPTRYFGFNPQFQKNLSDTSPTVSSLQSFIILNKRKAGLLGLLASLSDESAQLLMTKHENDDSENSTNRFVSEEYIDNFPMYLYPVTSTDELKIYGKHLVSAIQKAREEIISLNQNNTNKEGDEIISPQTKAKFVVYTGFINVLTD